METTLCDLCHSDQASVHMITSDWLLERPDVQSRFVRCHSCGLVYQNPRPSERDIGEHYPPQYDPYNFSVGKTPASAIGVTYGLRKRWRYIERWGITAGRLLDVGCSTGLFLEYVAQHTAWEPFGVEPNRRAADIARQKGLNVFQGTFEAQQFPKHYFDALTFWDVLEHLYSPRKALEKAHQILAPGGLLVIRVPNLKSVDASLFGANWAGWDAPRHLYIFTPATLNQLVTLAGFKVLSVDCNIGSYPTFILSVRFALTGLACPPSIRNRVLKWLNAPVVRLLSAPLFYVLSRGLRGPLITLVARK